MTNNFCSRPSRVFSGDVSALFGPDAQLYSVSVILPAALSTPFKFFIDTEIAAYSQFWNITRLQEQIFAPALGLNNWILSHVDKVWLCPNNMVQSQPLTPAGGIQHLQPQNVGVSLPGITRQAQGNVLAIKNFNTASPIIVSPGWFLRLQVLDNGGGPNFLPAGAKITLAMLRQIIPTNFVDLD